MGAVVRRYTITTPLVLALFLQQRDVPTSLFIKKYFLFIILYTRGYFFCLYINNIVYKQIIMTI